MPNQSIQLFKRMWRNHIQAVNKVARFEKYRRLQLNATPEEDQAMSEKADELWWEFEYGARCWTVSVYKHITDDLHEMGPEEETDLFLNGGPCSPITVFATGEPEVTLGRIRVPTVQVTPHCTLPLQLIRNIFYSAEDFSNEELGRAYEVLAGAVAAHTKKELLSAEGEPLDDELPSDLTNVPSRANRVPAANRTVQVGPLRVSAKTY